MQHLQASNNQLTKEIENLQATIHFLTAESRSNQANIEDVNKLQKENIRLNNALKTARENLAIAGRNQNNTSSQQLLPSEFKSKWESLVTDQLANTFINFFENPILLTNILQDLFEIVHATAAAEILSVTHAAMHLLHLPEKHAPIFS